MIEAITVSCCCDTWDVTATEINQAAGERLNDLRGVTVNACSQKVTLHFVDGTTREFKKEN